METKEIIILIVAVSIIICAFPYIIGISNFVGEIFHDYVKTAITAYKEDWRDCVKIVKRWFGK